MALTGVAQALSWDYISFLFFALLNAVGTSGVYPLAFIIGVEMVGPRKREMSSIVLNFFYAVGGGLKKIAAAESCCCSFFCFCVHAVMYAT